MNEKRNNNWQRWLYWFGLGLTLIVISKLLDNYHEVKEY